MLEAKYVYVSRKSSCDFEKRLTFRVTDFLIYDAIKVTDIIANFCFVIVQTILMFRWDEISYKKTVHILYTIFCSYNESYECFMNVVHCYIPGVDRLFHSWAKLKN